jgi:uncharacterized protein (TIGR03067 family)
MKLLLLLIPATVLLIGADDPKEAAKKELKKLQGTWMLIGHVENGQTTTEEQNKKAKVKLVVKGDKYTISFGDTVAGKGTIQLDPKKKPKEIDNTLGDGPFKGKAMLGIYELKDGVLRICNAVPGKPRPKEFSAKKGSGRYLITYKWVKD